jgi:DNA-binding transcriptional LysR family regulator
VAANIERGELKEMLQGYTPPPVSVSVVYPSSRHLSPGGARFRRLGARYR